MNIYWLEQSETAVPEEDGWLGPNELRHLRGLRIPKRRNDWRLGRWTGKRAVAAYLLLTNREEQDVEIRPSMSGAPEVFLDGKLADIAISLSHRAGSAACAVAPFGTILGCDLELIEPRSDAFLADYFTDAEQAWIRRAAATHRDQLVTVLWSAKESALKALRTGLRLDTRSVSVSLGTQPTSSNVAQASRCAFPAEDWLPLSVICTNRFVFHGRWQCSGGFARTVVSAPPAEALSILPTTTLT